jgi:hypothetical protein
MHNICLAPVLAGFVFSFLITTSAVCGAVFEEDFVSDPNASEWRIHGESQLFRWNATAEHLQVTWDSTKPNSYFYRPLGTVLGKEDDFELHFDLRIVQVEIGINEQKPFTFQLSIGLLNFEQAIKPEFLRGTAENSPDIVEFNYFPDSGFGATISTVIVSSDNQFVPGFNFPLELSVGSLFRVEMSYSASERTLATRMLRDGEAYGPINDVRLIDGFTDFRVDTMAVSSYSDIGSDGSLLGSGVIDNIRLVLPESPVRDFDGRPVEGVWQGEFTGKAGWSYTLERSEDLRSWTAASAPVPGTGARQEIQDSTGVQAGGAVFYRVRAAR